MPRKKWHQYVQAVSSGFLLCACLFASVLPVKANSTWLCSLMVYPQAPEQPPLALRVEEKDTVLLTWILTPGAYEVRQPQQYKIVESNDAGLIATQLAALKPPQLTWIPSNLGMHLILLDKSTGDYQEVTVGTNILHGPRGEISSKCKWDLK